MKEQDFDEIGKRLYDLEAAPPEKGWKRIAGTLINLSLTRRVPWIRKNWWKPFVLIIPTLLYLGYNELDGTNSTLAPDADVTKFEEQAGASGEPLVATPTNDQLQDAESINGRVSTSSEEQARSSEGSRSIYANADDASNINVIHPSQKTVSNKTGRNNIPYVSTPLITNNSTDGNTADSGPSTRNEIPGKDEVSSYKVDGAVADEPIANIPTYERSLEHAGVGAAATTAQPETNEDNTKLNRTAETDSISVKTDSDKSAVESTPTWRINVSIMPQYINRTIQPLATDDVFVTKVEGKDAPTRTGVEIGLGVARSLSNNWYVDARLSYNNLTQEFTHSFSDGKVDTLISVKQPDESIRVTPVYHVTSREIKSDYHCASLSLGTTYYFWSTAKRRFNLSASADMHYLLSAQIKEKINDQWVSLGDNTTSKTNYSLTIGAGYNITLYKGLELMIRPSLRYFTTIKSAELPYKLNQRSVGINFMLSKTIGRD